MTEEAGLRIDKWLWHARFFKTRSLAAELCQSGKVRIGRAPVRKTHQRVKPGDVLTFPQGRHIRVIKVLHISERRGPASEAQQLYEDLDPPVPENRLPKGTPPAVARRARGSGRPTKRERRLTDHLRRSGD